eukprot:490059-Pleurochrysis_carterae.AAC.2
MARKKAHMASARQPSPPLPPPPVHHHRHRHLSPLCAVARAQVPAAAGAGYALKLLKKDRCAITYFGEGCASEGDIPSALNIAA